MTFQLNFSLQMGKMIVYVSLYPSLHPQLLQLIAKSQLTSLSGAAQKNYFNVLEKIVQKGNMHVIIT